MVRPLEPYFNWRIVKSIRREARGVVIYDPNKAPISDVPVGEDPPDKTVEQLFEALETNMED